MGRWHRRSAVADDRHAAAHLVAVGCRKVLRGSGRVHDRCGAAADCQGVRPQRGAAWAGRSRIAVRDTDRGQRLGWPFRSLRPQADVHRRIGHLHLLSGAGCLQPEFRVAACLPLRDGACARMRLSDRAPGDFRKLADAQPRQARSRGVRLPSRRCARRDGGGLSHPVSRKSQPGGLALDVRHRNRAGGSGPAGTGSTSPKARIGSRCGDETGRPRRRLAACSCATRPIRRR